MPTGGGVCDTRWLCSDETSAVGAAIAVIAVFTAVWFAHAKLRTFLASWLLAASTHRLVWGVPVVGQQFTSVSDLSTATTDLGWLYTRQIYVPVELGVLNLCFYSVIMQLPATTYATAAYWTAAVWLSVQYWDDPAAPLYTLHDVGGLFLSVAWLYAGGVAGTTPRRTSTSAPQTASPASKASPSRPAPVPPPARAPGSKSPAAAEPAPASRS